MILTFMFFLVFNIISMPVDFLIRLLQALTGEED